MLFSALHIITSASAAPIGIQERGTMNAYNTGENEAFHAMMLYQVSSSEQFEKMGKQRAAALYQYSPAKQEKFLQGWMARWERVQNLPPPPRDEIQTY